MKMNLIFKRTISGQVEMILVPVDIPQVDEEGGWILASACNTFEVREHPTIEQVSKKLEEFLPTAIKEAPYTQEVTTADLNLDSSAKDTEPKKSIPLGGKYQSTVPGTARLVRYKDTIRITYRKGKTTFNQNDPNSVCIDDVTKQQFFNAVKRIYGPDTAEWKLQSVHPEFEYFNKLIDKVYQEGLKKASC